MIYSSTLFKMRNIFTLTFFALILFFSCKQATKTDEKTEAPNISSPITSCYLLVIEKDTNAFQLTINPDNSATGYIAWEPFEQDGGRGFFEGQKNDSLLSGDFTYMIEGAIQIEEVIFKLVENGVAKGRGALNDSGNRFVIIDKSSLNFEDIYKTVDCSKITSPVTNAKAVTIFIKNERAKRYESLTGTYSYDLGNDQGAGELLVKQLENNQVKVSFNIVMHGPAFNQGSGEGIITLNENLEGDFMTDEFGEECKIRFSFNGNRVISKQLAGNFMDCGFGNNVYADQEFSKTNSIDPFTSKE